MKEVLYDERDADKAVRAVEISNEYRTVLSSVEAREATHEIPEKVATNTRRLQIAEERAAMHQLEGGFREAYRFTLLSLTYLRTATVYRAIAKGTEWAEGVKWQEALVEYEVTSVDAALDNLRASLEQSHKPKIEIDWFPGHQNYRSTVHYGYQGLISMGDVEYGRYTFTPCVISLTTNPRLATDLPLSIPDDQGPFHSLEASQNWVLGKFAYLEGLDAGA